MTEVLSFFASCFTKPQWTNFCSYVSALAALTNKSFAGMSDALIERKDASSLSRFLSSFAWSDDAVYQQYLRKIRHLFARQWVSLIIDDSLSRKTGKHLFGVQFHKDHMGGGFVFGHQVVTALLRSRDILLPLLPLLYHKHSSSKIALAREQILLALRYVKLREVVMDSWYMCAELMQLCIERGVTVIGCLKSNRRFTINGRHTKCSKYFRNLDRKKMPRLVANDQTYRYFEALVMLRDVGLVKLLIVQQWRTEHGRWSRPFYLVSTDTRRGALSIITTYTERWSIETFHRDIKQHLGLEACHARRLTSITRHLMLVAVTYAALKLWQCWEKLEGTIGDLVRTLQHDNLTQMLDSIVEENTLEGRRKIAAHLLSKNA
jgi:hypothetical protein